MNIIDIAIKRPVTVVMGVLPPQCPRRMDAVPAGEERVFCPETGIRGGTAHMIAWRMF
jgi:hypothetical protein